MNRPETDEDIRRLLERDETRTSARHDEAVLAAARAMASAVEPEQRQAPTGADRRASSARQWKVPAALAATFAAGAVLGVVFSAALGDGFGRVNARGSEAALTLPLGNTRGGSQTEIPVEQAMPEDWYRYIQELIVAGETQEAERHLHRFNELHPNYAHQP